MFLSTNRLSENMSHTAPQAPSKQELDRALRGEEPFGKFISQGDFVDVMGAARWRLIRVFADARTTPQKGATSGYILGLDAKLTSLAEYVEEAMHERAQRKIYCTADLPPDYRLLNNRDQHRVVGVIRRELFMRLLTLMREEHDLWRMEGEWRVPQSVVDEYLLRTKRAKQSYRDERCFHGRPRRDRARLRQLRFAGGVSTGA
jgi:hypothetical protein